MLGCMRKVFLALALAGAALSLFGCTALLGSFEVEPGSGGADGGDADGGTAGDAEADAPDAAAFLMQCGVAGPPRELATNPGGFDRELRVYRGMQGVLVIARKRNAEELDVFGFDPRQNGNAPKADSVKAPGVILELTGTTGRAIALNLYRDEMVNPPVARLKLISIEDGTLTITERVISQDVPFGADDYSGATAAVGGDDAFFVLSRPSTQPGFSQQIDVGRSTQVMPLAPLSTIHRGSGGGETRVRAVVASGGRAYVFDDKGPDGPNSPGTSYWEVSDDGTGGITPPKPAHAPGTKPHVLIAAASRVGPGMRAAFAEVDLAPGAATPGVLKIGEVSQAELSAMDANKLPQAFTLTSLVDAPIEGGEARFVGDDFLWVGTPPDPFRGQGLNFYWYDVKNRVIRARNNKDTSKLLGDRTNIQFSSMTFAAPPSGISATLDLVWTEFDANANVGKLFYATVGCVR